MKSLDEKKVDRFRFLNKMYEITEGSKHMVVNMWELGSELGFTKEETDNVVEYLAGEYLLEHIAMGGAIGITHAGVVEVEQVLSHPDEPTDYFPPLVNIIQIEHMNGSQIQQGTIESTLSVTLGEDRRTELESLLKEIRTALDELQLTGESGQDAGAHLETIESQMKVSKPRLSIIAESLQSLRTILETAGGTIVAQKILAFLG